MSHAPRKCVHCQFYFTPKWKYARYCSKSCVWKATKGVEFNRKIAREGVAPKHRPWEKRWGTK